MRAQSIQHWAMGCMIGVLGSRTALGPTQPPIQWIPWALPRGVKWLEHEVDYSPPSSAKVKE